MIKKQIGLTNLDELRKQFFSKPKACFRASPLVKKYGWGIHYDGQGKIAMFEVNSYKYNELLNSNNISLLKGMRSKRK